MQISKQTLNEFIHGSVYNEEKDDYILFYRCTKGQIDYLEKVNEFFYDRTKFQASVTLEFDTDATIVSFDYKIFNIGSLDSFDIYVDGIAYQFIQLTNEPNESTIKVELPEGKKNIVIYLPCDSEIGIKDLCINGNLELPTVNKELVLCYGDSITNGFGSFRSSVIYLNVAARKLGWDVVNQGIGGYYFDEKYIYPINKTPDKILVAFGTNQILWNDITGNIEKFFERISKVYPNIPVLVISPIWRGDVVGASKILTIIKDYIFNVCENYPNITVVDGFTLVPHIEYYYHDKLHPNGLGMEVYGNNLAKFVKKTNW